MIKRPHINFVFFPSLISLAGFSKKTKQNVVMSRSLPPRGCWASGLLDKMTSKWQPIWETPTHNTHLWRRRLPVSCSCRLIAFQRPWWLSQSICWQLRPPCPTAESCKMSLTTQIGTLLLKGRRSSTLDAAKQKPVAEWSNKGQLKLKHKLRQAVCHPSNEMFNTGRR